MHMYMHIVTLSDNEQCSGQNILPAILNNLLHVYGPFCMENGIYKYYYTILVILLYYYYPRPDVKLHPQLLFNYN